VLFWAMFSTSQGPLVGKVTMPLDNRRVILQCYESQAVCF
jgi:hypothetical protein